MNGMPDSAGNIEEIDNSLKASFNRGRSTLDQDVVAASKRVLLHNIEFEPASAPYSMKMDELRAKYQPLNPSSMQNKGRSPGPPQQQITAGPTHNERNGEVLPIPKVVLYPEEKVKMEWVRSSRIGSGLCNMGNTCFFNSTLQCLTYTAPLANYCYTDDHKAKCRKKDFCMMCEIQRHIKTSFEYSGKPFRPLSILQKLKCIAKHIKWGRQEDAHEFLRYVIDHLQQSCLYGESSKLDRFSKETTVVNQIFGGYLRSQVICVQCKAKSNTFDPFMDLSLDIRQSGSVEEALNKYVSAEVLDHENAYKCPKCKTKGKAIKRFSIQKPPNILTLQLNRFDFHRHIAGKINKFVRFPEKIDIRKYMSQKQGDPVLYHLYGVIVHSGYSMDHGHYYCYVKSPTKMWFCMNDSIVHQVNTNTVLNADAYVLFYARINKGNSSSSSTSSTANSVYVKNPSSPMKSAHPSSSHFNHLKQDRSPMVNGIHAKATSELGTPIKREPPSGISPTVASNGPKIVPHATSASALPGSHNKISFPILTAQQKKLQQQQQQQKDDGKRIVLQIKDGNSTTMEKSPDGKSKVVKNGNGVAGMKTNKLSLSRHSGLVPYNDDSDSEQENDRNGNHRAFGNGKQKTSSTETLNHKNATISSAGDGYHSVSSVKKTVYPSDHGDGDAARLLSKPGSTYSSSQAHNNTSSIPPSNHPAHVPSHSKGTGDSLNIHLPTHNGKAPVNKSSQAKSVSTGKGQGHLAPLEHLPVVTVSSSNSGTPTKVKSAAGNWSVQPQDSFPSPRDSCSSNNSINSTTEWKVEAKESSAPGKSKSSRHLDDHNLAKKLFPFPPVSESGSSSHKGTALHNKSLLSKEESQSAKHSNHSNVNEKRTQRDTERSLTPVDISDKQLLVSPSSSDNGSRKSKKHKKKHKKKSKGDSDYDQVHRDDSSSRSDSSSRKKKKHKHKKKADKKLKNRRDSDSSDSDSSSSRKRKKKYDSDSSDSSDHIKQKKKRHSSDDEDADYEWVEKKVEPSPKTHKQVTVQSWDYHVKDDVAPKKDKTFKFHSNWDGSKTSKVSNYLGASHHGLAKVLSWDGGKNHFEKDRELDKSKKRDWADDYNESIDAGKVKKVKKHHEDRDFSASNPFQNHFNSKLKSSEKKSSWSEDHSYHQLQDHHYHKKYRDQPWLNSDFNPKQYQDNGPSLHRKSSSSHY